MDKNPGLRPIGVGEVLRRIAGKVVMTVIKTDVEETVGSLQACGGQSGGCEAAIHAMRTIYEEESTDAILLIDAANAFNSVNRAAMLQNIQVTSHDGGRTCVRSSRATQCWFCLFDGTVTSLIFKISLK